MLDYRNNRLDYGEMLVAPSGYVLGRAVATTYSANLDTLLSIPVALAYAQTLEGDLDGERLQILEGVRAVSEKLTVYHQKGQIHVPRKLNRLYAFLEDMLKPVYPGNENTTFHPKLWVLRYESKDGSDYDRFRVIVLSRNLTFDRSWDIAVCLDGVLTDQPQRRNKPLADFLMYLNELSLVPGMAEFAADVDCVEFEVPHGFKSLEFHPIGIPKHYINPAFSMEADRAAVVSPFLDEHAVTTLNKNVSEGIHLFSRQYELSKMDASVLAHCGSCYAISDWIVDGERQLEAESSGDEVKEQDLHAKVYVFEESGRTRWLLGSANATSAAMKRNTEFLVELAERPHTGGLDALLDELLGEERDLGVFEGFQPEDATGDDPDAESREAMRKLQYDLLGAKLSGVVSSSDNQINHDLTLLLNLSKIASAPGSKVAVYVHPLGVDGEAKRVDLGEDNELLFENLKQTELSRFIVFKICMNESPDRRFLVKVDISGMPETRHSAIFKSIVDSPEKFFEYLRFLLVEEHSKQDLVDDKHHSPTSIQTDDALPWHSGIPIFETLLVAASRSPQKLRHIDSVIERLRDDDADEEVVVPQEFLDFWDVWRPLIPVIPSEGTEK
jgi:hypothetical protein